MYIVDMCIYTYVIGYMAGHVMKPLAGHGAHSQCIRDTTDVAGQLQVIFRGTSSMRESVTLLEPF